MFAVVPEVFPHRDSGIRRKKLKGRRVTRRGRDHGGVRHGPVVFQGFDDAGDRGPFLTDGHVNAVDVQPLLIDDGIGGNRGFPRLAITDNEFALAAANGNHGVDRFQPGLQGFTHGLALNHPRSPDFDQTGLRGLNRTFSIYGLPNGIHDAPDEGITNRNLGNAARSLDRIAFFNPRVGAHQHRAHAVFLQIQGHAEDVSWKLQ